MTPEGRVKAKVRKLLSSYPGLYQHWPVPGGYGRSTVDVLGCYRGRFFCVEAKAEGRKPTLRQEKMLEDMQLAMGRTFVVAGVDSSAFGELRAWLDKLTETIDDDPHIAPAQIRRRAI